MAVSVVHMTWQPPQAAKHDGDRNPVGHRRGDRRGVDANQWQQREEQGHGEDRSESFRPGHDGRLVPAP